MPELQCGAMGYNGVYNNGYPHLPSQVQCKSVAEALNKLDGVSNVQCGGSWLGDRPLSGLWLSSQDQCNSVATVLNGLDGVSNVRCGHNNYLRIEPECEKYAEILTGHLQRDRVVKLQEQFRGSEIEAVEIDSALSSSGRGQTMIHLASESSSNTMALPLTRDDETVGADGGHIFLVGKMSTIEKDNTTMSTLPAMFFEDTSTKIQAGKESFDKDPFFDKCANSSVGWGHHPPAYIPEYGYTDSNFLVFCISETTVCMTGDVVATKSIGHFVNLHGGWAPGTTTRFPDGATNGAGWSRDVDIMGSGPWVSMLPEDSEGPGTNIHISIHWELAGSSNTCTNPNPSEVPTDTISGNEWYVGETVTPYAQSGCNSGSCGPEYLRASSCPTVPSVLDEVAAANGVSRRFSCYGINDLVAIGGTSHAAECKDAVQHLVAAIDGLNVACTTLGLNTYLTSANPNAAIALLNAYATTTTTTTTIPKTMFSIYRETHRRSTSTFEVTPIQVQAPAVHLWEDLASTGCNANSDPDGVAGTYASLPAAQAACVAQSLCTAVVEYFGTSGGGGDGEEKEFLLCTDTRKQDLRSGSGDTTRWLDRQIDDGTDDATDTDDGELHLWEVVYKNCSTESPYVLLGLDGTVVADEVAAATIIPGLCSPFQTLRVGDVNPSSRNLDFHFGEARVYSRPLSDAHRTKEVAALKAKWGIGCPASCHHCDGSGQCCYTLLDDQPWRDECLYTPPRLNPNSTAALTSLL